MLVRFRYYFVVAKNIGKVKKIFNLLSYKNIANLRLEIVPAEGKVENLSSEAAYGAKINLTGLIKF